MLDKPDLKPDPYARSAPRTPLLRMWEEFVLALTLLTRIPVPSFKFKTAADHGTAFWAYPIVGGIVGLIGGIAYAFTAWLGLGENASVLCAVAAMVMATGCFHEDGFADFADGVGGGLTRARKLEIMRDSRLGTYGAMALVLLLLASVFLILELIRSPWKPPFGGMVSVLVAVGMIQRAMIGIPLELLDPAREDGLSADTPRPPSEIIALGIALATVAAMVLLGVVPALAAISAAAVAALIITGIASHHLGGRTGDALGAAASLAGLAALAALVVFGKAAVAPL